MKQIMIIEDDAKISEYLHSYIQYVQKPWTQLKKDFLGCETTLANCVFIIVNLAQLLHPFLPFSSRDVQQMLQLEELKWEPTKVESVTLRNVKPLFERFDVDRIDGELEKLNRSIYKS